MIRDQWARRFSESHLVKGEKAASRFILLSQADNALLIEAAAAAGLSPSFLAARIVALALRQNVPRYRRIS